VRRRGGVARMKVRIDSCSRWDCEIDFFPPKPLNISYQYVESLEKLKELVKSDMVWPAKIHNYEKWMKNYKIVADLGYVIFYGDGGKIARIVGVHLFHSTWLERPELRIVEIAEFVPEFFDDDDD
jgi:hypothetical protein